MKYLCLSYGDEQGWSALTKGEQETLLHRTKCCGNAETLWRPCNPG